MQRIELLAGILSAGLLCAQVVSPPEIRDPELRELQQKHFAELKAVAVAITSHQFPYRFYFSRTLDLNEDQQKTRDQRSIQFAKYGHQTVVEILGNYYAAYSDELMKKEERARRTFEDVMLPILRAEVPQLSDEPAIQGFALEISHHVRKKVLGVSGEHPENVVLVIPKAAALRLVAAPDEATQAVALEEGSLFINGEAATIWGRMTADLPAAPVTAPSPAPPVPATVVVAKPAPPPPPAPAAAAVAPEPTPDALHALQTSYRETLDKMVRELDPTAHFVSYAPPVFVNFHKGIYLQLSITTTIQSPETASRYRAAALAFDEHIAHLIRPVLACFKDAPKFAGIDFSTTVKPAGQAVEYIFDLTNLRCYEQFDCTGQQIVNSGFVLINGERVTLDLEGAER
jgi:RecB family exonuclease